MLRPQYKYEKVTPDNAEEFAANKFKALPELYFKWNMLHSKCLIKMLDILCEGKGINKEKLVALAWVHDVGKIISEENHALHSVKMLKEEFD